MLRIGNMADCPAVYRLICDMEQTKLSYDVFSQIYEKQLGYKEYVCLIFEQEQQVVGVLNLRLEWQLHHAALIAEIMEFAVDPHLCSKGIGKKLFAYAAQLAKEAGCLQIEVACNRLRTETHRFYLREGMQKYHYKFTKSLQGEEIKENAIGR